MRKDPTAGAATPAADTTASGSVAPPAPAATAAPEHPNPTEGGCYVRLPSGELQREDN